MYGHFHKAPLRRKVLNIVWRYKWASLCFVMSAYLFASSGYIHAKAQLAQYLIEDAWVESLHSGEKIAPWAWADTWPVAKLNIADQSLYVLAGATGRVMAFGPGHMSSTPFPGEPGNAVITGHRDTHFALLQEIKIGDVITTETVNNVSQYEVLEVRIAHQNQINLTESGIDDELTLITCYPFNSAAPNPELRYVVRALKIDA
ncbi:class GN sortase [Aliiglaciecola sp. 2_MG-2023]|uniref:class GN sortase n=1 Tax=unclassified Aliiglaciecola TaxID=2593648 RepID=UPI0026E1CB0B|nr:MULTISPECIES: class GN sortase [unclassified Aliiglaciecola]MDO6712948.1 class GN sortase [Aliiglaciecola sp. 2_MG-2023]MDO6753987.1 class GN sortase [Aliiglaciecola sp. 1_MG-2023]